MTDELKTQKKRWRTQLFDERKILPEPSKKEANDRIITELLDLIKSSGAQKIAAYAADDSEPGGAELVSALYGATQELWLPLSKPQGILEWGQYTGADSLAPGAYGIPEPCGEVRSSLPLLNELDLIVVPALGARPTGERLGKGAGYYDRALAEATTPQVMLLFAHEISPDIPAADHDAVIPRIIAF